MQKFEYGVLSKLVFHFSKSNADVTKNQRNYHIGYATSIIAHKDVSSLKHVQLCKAEETYT